MDIEVYSECECVYMHESLYASYLVQFSYRNVFVIPCETLQPLLPVILQLRKTSNFQASVKKLYLKATEATGNLSIISGEARLGSYVSNTVSGYLSFVPCCLQNFCKTAGTQSLSLSCLHICKMGMTTLPQRNVTKLHL